MGPGVPLVLIDPLQGGLFLYLYKIQEIISIKVIHLKNVLSNKERIDLLNFCKPHLLTGEELSRRFNGCYPPSKQTLSTLHKFDEIRPVIMKIISKVNNETDLNIGTDKVWMNWNSGKKEEQYWHTHPCDLALVYYVKTIPFLNDGTCFKDKFVRSPQNSLIIFPGNKLHSVPSYPFRFERYTLAMDLWLCN